MNAINTGLMCRSRVWSDLSHYELLVYAIVDISLCVLWGVFFYDKTLSCHRRILSDSPFMPSLTSVAATIQSV